MKKKKRTGKKGERLIVYAEERGWEMMFCPRFGDPNTRNFVIRCPW